MNELERFGNRIADLEEKLERLMETGIGLGHSSFDDGRINQYSGGVLGGSFGTQFDGSNGAVALSGPIPPTPRWTDKWGPMAEGIVGGLRVRWEGFFEPSDLTVAPLDFSHLEVHVSKQSTLDGVIFETLKTTINSARGGEVLIPLPVDPDGYYIRLTARSTAGKRSQASTVLGPFLPIKIREEDLGFDLAELGGTTIHYGTTDPAAADAKLGDLWMKDVTPAGATTPEYLTYRLVPGNPPSWVLMADQRGTQALAAAISAQQAADSKAKVFAQATAPTWSGPAGSAVWYDSSTGNVPKVWDGDSFEIKRLGNGAIQPNSLVARDVIATGTVSAALLETVLVLATVIIAGDPNATHVKIKQDGVYVYSADPLDGVPNEVIRIGTASNDFFGITDGDGILILSLDDTGAINARTANFREDIVVGGRTLSDLIETTSTNHHYGYAPGGVAAITTEIGLIETAFDPTPGHMYWVVPEVMWTRNNNEAELVLQVRNGGTASPDLNSEIIYRRQFSNVLNNGYGVIASSPGLWRAPDVASHRRFLLTAQRGGSGGVNVTNDLLPTLSFIDLGPAKPILASVNRGGGSAGGTPPPPSLQQYDTGELVPLGWNSYRGDGSRRDDVAGPVQGWDQSGYNGNGKGYWYWNIPSITGTVDRVDVYLYSEHWHYSSGGTAILNVVPGNAGGAAFAKARTDWYVGGWPKPGAKWVTLPSDWNALFHNNGAYGYGKANGISVGPGPGTDLNYYGKFNGSAARLRIWYTQ